MIGPTLPNSGEKAKHGADDSKRAQRESLRAAGAGAAVNHHADQKNAEETRKKRQRRRSEENTADQRGGHAGQSEPTHDGQVQLTLVEPGAAQVPDQLRHGENRDRLPHAEGGDEQRQQHGRAAETRHRRQQRTHKSATCQQDQICDGDECIHTTSRQLQVAQNEEHSESELGSAVNEFNRREDESGFYALDQIQTELCLAFHRAIT
jgi:hypothetical protein